MMKMFKFISEFIPIIYNNTAKNFHERSWNFVSLKSFDELSYSY